MLLRERIESKQHQQQTRAEKWCDSVNDECECPGEQCGTMYMNVLIKFRKTPLEDFNNEMLRQKFKDKLRNIKSKWPTYSVHWHQDSPTCDLANMLRELLPRVGGNGYPSPSKWPYCSQNTIDDVKAMRRIRSNHLTPSDNEMRQTLQDRSEEYADSGVGSIAEAILYNDCYWTGQLAHEPPSGPKAEAMKRRCSSNN
jgi:hypothetical protein